MRCYLSPAMTDIISIFILLLWIQVFHLVLFDTYSSLQFSTSMSRCHSTLLCLAAILHFYVSLPFYTSMSRCIATYFGHSSPLPGGSMPSIFFPPFLPCLPHHSFSHVNVPFIASAYDQKLSLSLSSNHLMNSPIILLRS